MRNVRGSGTMRDWSELHDEDMDANPIQTVGPDSLVTLNYRVAGMDDQAFISTFDATPATLQLGNGELAPTLERCLEGLATGERRLFLLEPEQAFGQHNPRLVRRLPRTELPELPGGEPIGMMNLLEFTAANGARYTGLVRELDEEAALIDFNHPLAGKTIRFEVEVIGIL
ncbi:MAG TPA: FKBP-type peptidyl-prolyl cis-trans isomerase [Rhodocyclaceae bacterium]|nr:FKBP-type peptidyl-prolyl cis-trans isomerase [Rhodocyclaceae bacterium]